MKKLKVSYKIEYLPNARSHLMLERYPNIMYVALFRTAERELKYKWCKICR